jgi:hypothetical protein
MIENRGLENKLSAFRFVKTGRSPAIPLWLESPRLTREQRMTVDPEFIREAQKGRAPETRFRFAQPCIESGCKQ